ncbi:MAG: hypothetical protein HC862_26910 [Scytonema sp. RU_4_4]|nr:hypothetical protein [Scytonema sp. RU_4_4]
MEGKNNEIIKRRSQLSPAKQAILEKRLRGESEYNQEISIPRRTHKAHVLCLCLNSDCGLSNN